jgi:membrane associated rhomboid family serine protease
MRERVRRTSATSVVVVTSALIAVNLAVFVTSPTAAWGRAVTATDARWGLWGPAVAAGEWWRLVTSGFLHGGVVHLAMNMLALWVLGRSMEDGVGRVRFLAIYAVSLLGGSAGALLVTPGELTIGASGAIYGLAGAATVALWRRGASLRSIPWVPLLAVNLLLTVSIPGISLGGHLGGLAAGGLAGLLLLDHRARRVVPSVAVVLVLVAACVGASLLKVDQTYGRCVGEPDGRYECEEPLRR